MNGPESFPAAQRRHLGERRRREKRDIGYGGAPTATPSLPHRTHHEQWEMSGEGVGVPGA